MEQIVILISTALTNGLVQLVKSKKPEELSEEQKMKRKKTLRLFGAVFSIVSVVGSSMLLGVEVDVSSIEQSIQLLISSGVAFGASQGAYFLKKSWK